MKRKNETFSNALVGVFMLVVLVLLGYFTIVISGVDVLSSRHRVPLRISFSHVGGLKARDNVMYRGTKVGAVDRVEVSPTNLVVVALVDDHVVLRTTARARVCTLSMLGGYYLSLDEGTGEALDFSKAVLAGDPPTDWMEDVSRIASNLNKLTSREEIETVVTNFAVLSERLRAISEKASDIMARISRGEGTVGRLLSSDETLYADLRGTVQSVSNAMARAGAAFDGVSAIADELRDEKTMADLKGGLAAFRATAESLNAGDLMKSAQELVDRLNAVAQRVEAGEGTLGRLTRDSKLYDELDGLLRDARQVLDNYRDTTPISTFSSLATGAL